MKRFFALLLSLMLFTALVPAQAEENTLVIGVLDASDARNIVLEEAFFETHPDVTIEYRLYRTEQLNSLMLSGGGKLDLVILPYSTMLNMAKKGYLASVYEALGQDTYPEQLMDYSDLLTWNGELFALPVSVTQQFWIWDNQVAKKANIDMPDLTAWTWEDYAELARTLPCDINGDGEADIFLMNGAMLPDYPAFSNVNTDMFQQYAALYTDFDLFGAQYLDLFREIICSDALLSLKSSSGEAILGVFSDSNPINILEIEQLFEDKNALYGITVADSSTIGFRFLPPPRLNSEQETYEGNMVACGLLKTSSKPELAADFLKAVISPKATDYSMIGRNDQLVGTHVPAHAYDYMEGILTPTFKTKNGISTYRVTAGREIPVTEFQYDKAVFEKAQEFRSKLAINTVLLGRDFYDAAWSNLQEWYCGRMTDAELIDAMNFLFGMAHG